MKKIILLSLLTVGLRAQSVTPMYVGTEMQSGPVSVLVLPANVTAISLSLPPVAAEFYPVSVVSVRTTVSGITVEEIVEQVFGQV